MTNPTNPQEIPGAKPTLPISAGKGPCDAFHHTTKDA